MLDEDIRDRPDRAAPSARATGLVPVLAGAALDIADAPLLVRLAGTRASMRFVQPMGDDDPDGTRFKALVRRLKLSSTDISFVIEPAGSDPVDRTPDDLRGRGDEP
jgi:hypothetical protein